MKVYLIFIVFAFFSSNMYSQELLDRQTIDGQSYYIVLENFGGTPKVWARKELNMSHPNDIEIGKFNIKSLPKNKAKALLCRNQKRFDDGAMLLGCASSIGSAVCLVTGGGSGFAATVCIFTINYGIKSGFVDCASGLSNKIANVMNEKNYISDVLLINYPSFRGVISKTIDEACTDWKKNN